MYWLARLNSKPLRLEKPLTPEANSLPKLVAFDRTKSIGSEMIVVEALNAEGEREEEGGEETCCAAKGDAGSAQAYTRSKMYLS